MGQFATYSFQGLPFKTVCQDFFYFSFFWVRQNYCKIMFQSKNFHHPKTKNKKIYILCFIFSYLAKQTFWKVVFNPKNCEYLYGQPLCCYHRTLATPRHVFSITLKHSHPHYLRRKVVNFFLNIDDKILKSGTQAIQMVSKKFHTGSSSVLHNTIKDIFNL